MLLIYKLWSLLLFVVIIIRVLKFLTENNCHVREKEKWKMKRQEKPIRFLHTACFTSLSAMDGWHTACPALKFLARDSLKVPPTVLWPETRNPSSTCYCGKICVSDKRPKAWNCVSEKICGMKGQLCDEYADGRVGSNPCARSFFLV